MTGMTSLEATTMKGTTREEIRTKVVKVFPTMTIGVSETKEAAVTAEGTMTTDTIDRRLLTRKGDT